VIAVQSELRLVGQMTVLLLGVNFLTWGVMVRSPRSTDSRLPYACGSRFGSKAGLLPELASR
jgi:hypothetical protein